MPNINDILDTFEIDKIKQENNFFKTTMDAIDAIVYVSEIETDKFLYINKYGKNILGDKIGQKCSSILDNKNNPPCNICKNHLKIEKNKKLNKKPFVWEFKNEASGKWFQCRVRVIEWKPNKYVKIGIASDITKRKETELALKESENKYRLIFEKNEDATFIIGEGKFIDCNNAALKLLGYKNKEQFFSVKQKDFYPEKQPNRISSVENQKKMMQVAFDEGFCRFEAIRTKASGENFPVDILLTAVPYNRKPVIHAIWRDLTKRYEVEKKLRDNEQKLKETIKTKDKFFSIIAHDLKSPFNGLIGLSDLLLKNFNKYKQEKLLFIYKLLNDSSKNTFALLENLLTWSRSQSGDINFSPERIQLKIFIDKVLVIQRQSADIKNIKIENNIDDSIYVFADKNMLNTIMRNLISNAIKFTKNDGNIILSAQEVKDESTIKIFVSDNGIGLSEEKLNNLFKIDKNISTAGTDGETGTGLGLILVKEFIEKNLGELKVKSEVGKGSVFSFTLPTADL